MIGKFCKLGGNDCLQKIEKMKIERKLKEN